LTVNATLCRAARYKGKVGSLIENPLPEACIAVILTSQFRALVRTRVRLEEPPSGTWPNDRLDGVAVTDVLSSPLPPACTAKVASELLLENLISPPAHPVVVGVKLMFTSALWPAGKTSGKVEVGVANAALVTEVSDKVILVSPPLVMVTTKVSVWPTSTLPNRRIEGEAVSFAAVAAALVGAKAKTRSTPMIGK